MYHVMEMIKLSSVILFDNNCNDDEDYEDDDDDDHLLTPANVSDTELSSAASSQQPGEVVATVILSL